jgi:hypothetical protein
VAVVRERLVLERLVLKRLVLKLLVLERLVLERLVLERLVLGCCPPGVSAALLVPVVLVGFDGEEGDRDEVDGDEVELGWLAVVFGRSEIPHPDGDGVLAPVVVPELVPERAGPDDPDLTLGAVLAAADMPGFGAASGGIGFEAKATGAATQVSGRT